MLLGGIGGGFSHSSLAAPEGVIWSWSFPSRSSSSVEPHIPCSLSMLIRDWRRGSRPLGESRESLSVNVLAKAVEEDTVLILSGEFTGGLSMKVEFIRFTAVRKSVLDITTQC